MPRLVFCINETFLTSNTAAIHSTVGECTKTMAMLADTASAAGRAHYQNILGAHEFASDTTRVLACVDGFEQLIAFIQHPRTREAKAALLRVGASIAAARTAAAPPPEQAALLAERTQLLHRFRARYYELCASERQAIDTFLTTSNKEIVGAKAMFLAYEDPFEKYRALLFECARHVCGRAGLRLG